MKSAILRQASRFNRDDANCSKLERTLNGASRHKLNSSTRVWCIIFFSTIILCLTFFSCNDTKEEQPALFEALDTRSTGIDFANKLTPTAQFNMFKYMYFYNGAGVGVGDFNNDGLSDIFFSSNQGCLLYTSPSPRDS